MFDTQNLADGYWNNQGTLIDATLTMHTNNIDVSNISKLRYWGYEKILDHVYSAFLNEDGTIYATFHHQIGDNIIDVPASAKYVSFSVGKPLFF